MTSTRGIPCAPLCCALLVGLAVCPAANGEQASRKGGRADSRNALVATIQKGKYKGLTVRASSNFDKERTPDRAFDGDLSTNWLPRRCPCWIQIDLGGEKTIGKIVWNGDRGTGYSKRIPEIYRFTGSSTGKFAGEQTVLAGIDGNFRNCNVAHVFKPTKVRYVRMEIYASYPVPRWQPNIDEIKVLPPPFQPKGQGDR